MSLRFHEKILTGKLLILLFMALAAPGAGRASEPAPLASADSIETHLYLLGDAGRPDPGGDPVLIALRREISSDPGRSLVVYLGDNIYARGLPELGFPQRAEAERRLTAQLDAIRGTGARVIFVPGNHDWAKGGERGWEAVQRQSDFIAAHGGDFAHMLPHPGCPGPEVEDVGTRLRLVAIDTEWWLFNWPRSGRDLPGCLATEQAVLDSLRAVLLGAVGRDVIVIAHHPLATGGPHGGHFTWRDHIFPLRTANKSLWLPLPIIGSLYPIARRMGVSPQDLSNGTNRHMREALESAFERRPPLIYASGHEHALQVLEGKNGCLLLVSGTGYYGHSNPVKYLKNSAWASDLSGFIRVDVTKNGRARVAGLTVDRNSQVRESYSTWRQPREAANR